MAHRDVIVVGASSGGFEALPKFVAGLPRDLQGAVLVVMHVAPNGPSWLAERIAAASPLRAAAAVDGEPLRAGQIYVAVPDHHLMIENERIRLTRRPRENFSRPSIDVLFRSAAYTCADRVIGVLLTGRLDDGTAGLWAIKDRGGVVIVQDPQEASYPSMPLSALRYVSVDYTLALRDIPAQLELLTKEPRQSREVAVMSHQPLAIESKIAGAEGIHSRRAAISHGPGAESREELDRAHPPAIANRTRIPLSALGSAHVPHAPAPARHRPGIASPRRTIR